MPQSNNGRVRRKVSGSVLSDNEQEMHSAIEQEARAIIAGGAVENTVMINGLCNNWSAAELRKVAQRRGLNWRFLSALSDTMLEIEGWALLSMVTTALGNDLLYNTLRKSAATIERIDDLVASYEAEYADESGYGADDYLQKMVDEAKQGLVDLSRTCNQAYLSNA